MKIVERALEITSQIEIAHNRITTQCNKLRTYLNLNPHFSFTITGSLVAIGCLQFAIDIRSQYFICSPDAEKAHLQLFSSAKPQAQSINPMLSLIVMLSFFKLLLLLRCFATKNTLRDFFFCFIAAGIYGLSLGVSSPLYEPHEITTEGREHIKNQFKTINFTPKDILMAQAGCAPTEFSHLLHWILKIITTSFVKFLVTMIGIIKSKKIMTQISETTRNESRFSSILRIGLAISMLFFLSSNEESFHHHSPALYCYTNPYDTWSNEDMFECYFQLKKTGMPYHKTETAILLSFCEFLPNLLSYIFEVGGYLFLASTIFSPKKRPTITSLPFAQQLSTHNITEEDTPNSGNTP